MSAHNVRTPNKVHVCLLFFFKSKLFIYFIFFYFSIKNMLRVAVSQQSTSNEYPQHKFFLEVRKYFLLATPLIWSYRIRPNYLTYPYKRTVKKFRSLQITANVLFLYFFIKACVVGTHLNCIDLSMQFKWVPTTYAFKKKIRKKIA